VLRGNGWEWERTRGKGSERIYVKGNPIVRVPWHSGSQVVKIRTLGRIVQRSGKHISEFA